MSAFRTNVHPPLDLTPYIPKANDQYVAGGSFGDVYKCWCHQGSPKEVAVKAFRFKLQGTSNRSAERELGIWRRLNHPNVVPFLGIAYGFGMHGVMSLVSLWMPNESLHHFLAKYNDHLRLEHRLRILLDIANGLHYLHSFPVVHGDLNCNNVLLDVDFTARLADFGYASLVGHIPEALAYLQRSTARPGALRWTAPEQLDAEETFNRSPKNDIYSFGCIILQVLSGKQPWSEVREDAAVIFRLGKGHKPGRPESQMLDDVHWNLIQRCWSPVDERPCTEVLIHAIQQFLKYCPQSPPLRESFVSVASHLDHSEGVPPSDVAGDNSHAQRSSRLFGTFNSIPPLPATIPLQGASNYPPYGRSSERESPSRKREREIGASRPGQAFRKHELVDEIRNNSSQYALPRSYKTITNNPLLMSFVDEVSSSSFNATSSTNPPPYTPSNHSEYEADFDSSWPTAIDPAMLSVPDEPLEAPMQTDPASLQSYKTGANNPLLMFTEEPSDPFDNSHFLDNFNFPSTSNSTGQSDFSQTNHNPDELFGGNLSRVEVAKHITAEGPSPFSHILNPSLDETSDISTGKIISCQGSNFPRTQDSADNIEVLKAWRCLAQNPRFKDPDINEIWYRFFEK